MSSEATALLGIAVTLLLTLIAVVWKGGALVSRLQAALDHVVATVAELKGSLADLKEIPVLRQRVGTLESALSAATKKLDTVYRKVFSHDKHIAVMRARSESQPAIEEHDTDPPTAD